MQNWNRHPANSKSCASICSSWVRTAYMMLKEDGCRSVCHPQRFPGSKGRGGECIQRITLYARQKKIGYGKTNFFQRCPQQARDPGGALPAQSKCQARPLCFLSRRHPRSSAAHPGCRGWVHPDALPGNNLPGLDRECDPVAQASVEAEDTRIALRMQAAVYARR